MTFLDDLMLMCSVLQLVITQMCILKILTSNGNITIVVYFYSANLLFSITKFNFVSKGRFINPLPDTVVRKGNANSKIGTQ